MNMNTNINLNNLNSFNNVNNPNINQMNNNMLLSFLGSIMSLNQNNQLQFGNIA